MADFPRELTKEEYEATFSPPMLDVTETAEENVPLWDYLDPVIEELYHTCSAWDWRVMFIYESRDGLIQHLNVPVPKDNTYLSVVVDKPNAGCAAGDHIQHLDQLRAFAAAARVGLIPVLAPGDFRNA